jgi:asparagine synthase (glutamine-hydrolysing)
MCGIAGFISLDGKPIETGVLFRMGKRIRHRGPDDEGYVLIQQQTGQYVACSGPDSPSSIRDRYPKIADRQHEFGYNIGLAHRRFSIIDLSSGGHQPFFDSEDMCCAVFNGEIYNYLELREKLQSMGHHFRSASDTEVIVEAYKAWGTECFCYFNGMWAMALYDFRRNVLIVSRDRLGKKPLYWTRTNDAIYFASEIKALFEVSDVWKGRSINRSAVYPWIAFSLRDLGETTFFANIYSTPAGSWAALDDSFPANASRYWQVPSKRLREKDISIREATLAIRETLQDSVRIRMRADVPWCVELSGGMDSSALVAYAAQQAEGRKLITYTVRFPEKEWDESEFAFSVASRYSTEHHVIDSPLENFWPEIVPFTQLEEEPYHSPNLHTNQVIRRMMRANGIKMLLNGAAGDELFAGYPYYFQKVQAENLIAGRIGQYIQNGLHWSESEEPLKALLSPAAKLMKETLKSGLWLLGIRRERHSYIKATGIRKNYDEIFATDALRADMINTKIPYWLRSGDKTHMGVPIEGRDPFLDFRMVELALTLPVTYLIRNGWHKWILRKALEDLLPADVLWRRKKMGFPFPYERFFSDSKAIIETIFEKSCNPFIDLSSRKNVYRDNYQFWRLISFVLWYELYINSNIKLLEEIQKMGRCNYEWVEYSYSPIFLETCKVSNR